MSDITKEFFDKLAPRWNDGETHSQDEMLRFISQNIPLKPGMRVLDVGCGTGVISEPISKLTGEKVLAIDLSSAMIEIAKATRLNPDIEFRQCDFFSLSESGFDALICFNAYPHFIDSSAFALKAYEVLKPGGICAVLHNMSRFALSKHHEALAKNVSRELLPVEEEAIAFADNFTALKLIDNNNMFLMLFIKPR